MPLSEFYLMNDEQIASLHEQLAENFYDDDLYKTVFMDDRTRLKTLRYLFRHYVKALKPYCHFLADSAERRSVMVVWDSTLEQPLQYHLQLLWLNLKMIPMLAGLRSVKSIRHVIECWDMFTSRWIQEFVQGDYLHLDLFFTAKELRGTGIGSAMLKALLVHAQEIGKDVTMETHHAESLSLYYRAGFVLMSEITHPDHDIHQYNLMRKCIREENLNE